MAAAGKQVVVDLSSVEAEVKRQIGPAGSLTYGVAIDGSDMSNRCVACNWVGFGGGGDGRLGHALWVGAVVCMPDRKTHFPGANLVWVWDYGA